MVCPFPLPLLQIPTIVVAAEDYQSLSDADLKGFKTYVYRSIDTSPVSKYVTKPFWNFCVDKLTPRWLAPNVLTLAGFLFQVSALLAAYVLNPSIASAAGSPVLQLFCLYGAFAQFAAHTLDGCDGIQARTTGSSSPLGELFDHGLDSMATWIMPLTVVHVTGLGAKGTLYDTDGLFWILWALLVSFYLCHMEKYMTGVLFLPWAYDISQIGLVIIYLVSRVWSQPLLDTPLPLPAAVSNTVAQIGLVDGVDVSAGTVTLGTLAVVGLAATSVGGWLESARRTRAARAVKPLPPHVPRRTLAEGLLPALPMMYLIICMYVWKTLCPEVYSADSVHLFWLLAGSLSSNVTCHLIVCSMAKSRFKLWNWRLAPAPFVIMLSYYRVLEPRLLLVLYTAIVVTAHFAYALAVVQDLCKLLNVYCFRILSRPRPV